MEKAHIQRWAPIAAILVVIFIIYFWFFANNKKQNISKADYWPTQGCKSTPEEQGFDSRKLAEGLTAIRAAGIDVHSLTMVRHGRLFLEAYFYPYDGQTVHELASVTKSMMTTLIGIATDEGSLSLEDKMLSFFPDRQIANRDTRKESDHCAPIGEHVFWSGMHCRAG